MILPTSENEDSEGDIRALLPSDIDQLRLGWWSRFDSSEVGRTLARAPGFSVWSPSTNEYLLAGPWRHRAEILNVIELVAIRHPIDLMRTAIAEARSGGIRLFLTVEMSERRQSGFYERCGLAMLEEVVSYELSDLRGRGQRGSSETIRPAGILDEVTLRDLRELDWDAFPWLWRNADDEFRDYVTQPGVEIHILREGEHPVGYVGISSYPGWGHIDRIAIKQTAQGRGYGRRLTDFAIDRLISLGAAKIGLSTQNRNVRSQSLYEKIGFRRQIAGEYRIYGAVLDSDDSMENLVAG